MAKDLWVLILKKPSAECSVAIMNIPTAKTQIRRLLITMLQISLVVYEATSLLVIEFILLDVVLFDDISSSPHSMNKFNTIRLVNL